MALIGGPTDWQGAEAYAHNTIKKHEQLPLKLGMLNPVISLCILPARRSTLPRLKASSPGAFSYERGEREFVKDWIQVPDESLNNIF